jgi:rubrerythrin
MGTDMATPVGLSSWEHELYEHLTQHMRTELELVDEYQSLAESSGGHVAYLLRLIMEDEARHHRLFAEWCNAIQSDAELREVAPQIPRLSTSADPASVKAAARKFRKIEEADAKELEGLKRSLKTVKDTTVWDLLVDVMELDTKKHQLILKFIERHPGT